MARFGNTPARPAAGPTSLGSTTTAVRTHERGVGYVGDDPHMELFNAAVTGMLTDNFYEKADERIKRLVSAVGACDPVWLQGFIPWLRTVALLRSAPVVLAAEYAAHGFPNARRVVDSALQRADEPGELIAFWHAFHGRKMPYGLKRGLADACTRLFDERAALRYDGKDRKWRLGDVIEIAHPKPKAQWQSTLFSFLLDRRRHDATVHPGLLPKVSKTLMVEELPVDQRTPARLRELLADRDIQFSWERAAGWLNGPMDARAWEAVIPTMGYFALLRNLNNFDRAQISPTVVDAVKSRLCDPAAVRGSKVLPFRFLTAYKALENDTYKVALSSAADIAVDNLPEFKGNTLIMVDCSGSMANPVGGGKSRQPLTLSELAGFTAEALATRCEHATIVCYNNSILSAHPPARHINLLRRASSAGYHAGGGTRTWTCTAQAVNGGRFDRVVIITDEQAYDADVSEVALPVITWNLAGYRSHHAAHGVRNRFYVGGYSDTAMQTLPSVISVGGTGRWPWE